MDDGANDDRSWTVKREKLDDGPLATAMGFAVPIVLGAVLGVVVGYLFPLIVASATGRSAHQRELDRGVGTRSVGERVVERAVDGETHRIKSRVRDAAWDAAAHGTASDARRRGLIGAVLGALAGAGLVVVSRKKR